MEEENESIDLGVSKDVESFNDIVGRQIAYINNYVTVGADVTFVENSISVFEALLSPYLPPEYLEDLQRLERESVVKLRLIRADERYFKEGSIISKFLLNKYAILLRYAKERGFLPKTLIW